MINILYTYNRVELAIELMEDIKYQMKGKGTHIDIDPEYMYDRANQIQKLLNEMKKHIDYK